MLLDLKNDSRLADLTERLKLATAPTADLVHDVIAGGCTCLTLLKRGGKTFTVDQFLRAGAWCDAALAAIELELPEWKLRRLEFEDSEWLCSLSKQRYLPIEPDDTVDAGHRAPALAILSAFLEAMGRRNAGHEIGSPAVPLIRPTSVDAICCDNFA